MKNFLIIAIALIATSCGENTEAHYKPNPKSIELNNKALEITMYARGDSIKVDSAIMLLDEATKIDSLYFQGYLNKIQFLMIKKDYKHLLKTNRRIIELRSNQPSWIIQKGLILELSGNLDEANKEYVKGIKQFENIIDIESDLSWEFEFEFAQSLVIANNYDKANDIIIRLKKDHPKSEILETFELQTKKELLEIINLSREMYKRQNQ